MDYLQHLYWKFLGDGQNCGTVAQRKVIAFGNVLLDRTVRLEDTALLERYQLPANSKGELPAETLAKLTAEPECANCVLNPGGAALNTVRILQRLGTDALFLGAVGADEHADHLKDMLKERGIETQLETIDDTPTGQCTCLVHEDTTTLYANIGASAKFSVDHLKKQAQDPSCTFLRPAERKQILYLEGFFVPQREAVCEFIVENYIRERRRLAVNLSAAYIVQQNFDQLLKLARHALFVFGNDSEFQAFVDKMGCKSVEEMAEKLLQGDAPKIIVITKGADGVQLITNFKDENAKAGDLTFQSFNPPRVEKVVDTTGAGDAFVAGFLHAWLEKRMLSECVRVATDVAAQVVTQIGCNLP